MKRAAACALAGMMVCGMLAGCGKKDAKIDGTKPLVTVNGESVSLGTGSFYAKFEQAQTYKYYTTYFGMSGSIFDQEMGDGSGKTYGDQMKENVLTDLEKNLVIRQHAEEYGVSLTDEEKEAISKAAQEYIDGNPEDVLQMVGASKEDLEELMTLQTYQSKMMDPIVKDVDTVVSDEEGQVSSLTYVRVSVPEEDEAASGAESAVTAVEPVAENTDAQSGTESTAEEVAENGRQLAAKAKAQAVIDAILAAGEVADADMSAIAKTVDDSLYSTPGQFTTFDPEDTSLDASVVEAVRELEDGTLVETPVRSDDGTSYFVVRFDKTYDEERTQTNKDAIVTERKQTLYDETVDKWVEEAEITVDDKAWEAVKLTDAAPLTLTDPEPSEETGAAADVVSAVESALAAVEVESIAEPVESAATEVLSLVEEAADAVSAAAEAVSEAAETVG